jgi:D-alanyl-lipoteichoic acid acyltransferase DltB (MBOAT superfamily)
LTTRRYFFSSNLYDFWQRWHISLTQWIKEYVYYPLALTKFWGKRIKAHFVIVLTWAIMGFWHGAAWKFILWGVYHGILLVIYARIRPYLMRMKPGPPFLSGIWKAAKVLLVFHLFCIGILFFAAETTPEVFLILRSIVLGWAKGLSYSTSFIAFLIATIIPLALIEYFQHRDDDKTAIFRAPVLVRALVYYVLFYLIISYGDFNAQKYYYFQF